MIQNNASTEQFKRFLVICYKELVSDLNLEDWDSIFQYFVNNGHWDYLNIDFLSKAVNEFADNALKAAEAEYQERLSAYMAMVKIGANTEEEPAKEDAELTEEEPTKEDAELTEEEPTKKEAKKEQHGIGELHFHFYKIVCLACSPSLSA